MKNILSIIALFAVITFASPTPGQAAPQPKTATEAVFFTQGMVEAQTEILADEAAQKVEGTWSVLPPVGTNHIGFRNMAGINNGVAALFHQLGYTLTAFYFWGRAEVFNQMADLAGEPAI